MASHILVVDSKDNIIGVKDYGDVQRSDIYRVAALWLTDKGSGEILLAQRQWTKRNNPGKWSCAAAGTVEEGESYEQNIIKEAAEEIGLSGLTPTIGPKLLVDNVTHRFFCQWFLASIDRVKTPLTIQKEEVAGLRWVTPRTLISDVKNNPTKYTPGTIDSLKALGVIERQTH